VKSRLRFEARHVSRIDDVASRVFVFGSANTVLAQILRMPSPSAEDQLSPFALQANPSRLWFILPPVFLSGALFQLILQAERPGHLIYFVPSIFRQGQIFHPQCWIFARYALTKRAAFGINFISIESAHLIDSLEDSHLRVNGYEPADCISEGSWKLSRRE